MRLNIENAIQSLENNGSGELLLDFSSVQRLDAADLAALERLSAAARKKGVKVSIQDAPVSVYRVLKLTRLDFHF